MKLDVEQLGVRFGDAIVLKEVSLSFEGQGFWGIIGPNGSGKSTLLKCLYRVLKPEKGCCYLDGKPLDHYSLKASARKIAVLAQHGAQGFDMNVLDLVLLGRSPYKGFSMLDTPEDHQRARRCLEQVDLGNFADRQFFSLSGGERQRVLLARALCQDTECLLLDEPTNHLDINHQIGLLRFLKDLPKMTVAALHDLNLAALFCDRLFLMSQGQIVTFGSPREVLTPQRICQVYGVKSQVWEDDQGYLRVNFFP